MKTCAFSNITNHGKEEAVKVRALACDPISDRVCRPEGVYRKPDYKVIERGTLFLVDVANLFGDAVFEDAANALRTIREALVSRGYRAVFFLERRAFTWLCCHQESDLKAEALRQFVKHESFSLVNGEADLGILQCARQIPNSVCLTNDHLNDYRAAFGEIVGTLRVRSFSWAKIDKCLYLSVNGLADAIVVRPKVEEPVAQKAQDDAEDRPSGERVALSAEADVADTPSCHCDEVREEKMLRPAKQGGNMAILSLGRSMLEKGCAEKALACFDKAARKGVADGYRAIAGAYATGNGVEKSDKMAAKYMKLAAKKERAARQRERRLARKMAMPFDAVDAKRHGRISAREAKAFRLAQFGGMYEFVREYFAACRPARRRFRAA